MFALFMSLTRPFKCRRNFNSTAPFPLSHSVCPFLSTDLLRWWKLAWHTTARRCGANPFRQATRASCIRAPSSAHFALLPFMAGWNDATLTAQRSPFWALACIAVGMTNEAPDAAVSIVKCQWIRQKPAMTRQGHSCNQQLRPIDQALASLVGRLCPVRDQPTARLIAVPGRRLSLAGIHSVWLACSTS